MQFGVKISDKHKQRLAEGVDKLGPGERGVLAVRTNKLRPLIDFVVVTDRRLLAVELSSFAKNGPKISLEAVEIAGLDCTQRKFREDHLATAVMVDGSRVELGTVEDGPRLQAVLEDLRATAQADPVEQMSGTADTEAVDSYLDAEAGPPTMPSLNAVTAAAADISPQASVSRGPDLSAEHQEEAERIGGAGPLGPVFCTNCGVAGSGKFCGACGAPMPPATGPQGGPVVVPASAVPPVTRGQGQLDAQPAPRPQKPPPKQGFKVAPGAFGRALSFRVGCGALFFAAIAGAGAGWLWDPLGTPVAIATFVIVWLTAVFLSDNVANCPRCFKKVKMGADTCHHCGARVKTSG